MLNLKSIINQKYNFFIFVLFIFLLVLGYYATSNFIDPDFGWHLKTGQLILERGVPKIDWYSYTMPNFPWIDHEWLTDIFIYKIYSIFGSALLLEIFLVIFTLAFIISIKRDLFLYFIVPVILGYLASLGFLGIRPQLLTVFFVAVLLFILGEFSEDYSTKLIYFCPILFLIWANLHGGFVIGLLLIFLILILELFKKTRLSKKIISLRFFSGQNFKEGSPEKIKGLSILFVISALLTFVNPYGPRLYEEIFRTFGDSFVKSHINEWLPLFYNGSFSYSFFTILYLGVFIGLLAVYYKKIEINNFILSIIFLGFAILSQRNLLIFIILTIPVFAELLFYFISAADLKQFKIIFSGYRKWMAILIILGLFAFGFYPYFIRNIKAKNNGPYPVKAVDFLKTLPLSDNLFNEYAWGGYLIWKLPERKLFIDGRMPCWRENGQFVFGDYIKVSEAQPGFDKILQKYDVRLVFIPKYIEDNAIALKKNNPTIASLRTFSEKHHWLGYILGTWPLRNNIYEELTKLGWKTIYHDDVALILKK